MKYRMFAAVLALFALPIVTLAQDKKEPTAADNPFRNVKEGDYAEFKVATKLGALSFDGNLTQTVIAKTEKEVTIKVEGKVSGMDFQATEYKIDLTKPFDTSKGIPIPGLESTATKDKDGKEKLKVEGKEVDSTWETFKVKAKLNSIEFDANSKVWTAKEVKFGVVKMEITADVAGNKVEMTAELTKTGEKK
jgi:hypothetical protein